jgi:hypothetical protein
VDGSAHGIGRIVHVQTTLTAHNRNISDVERVIWVYKTSKQLLMIHDGKMYSEGEKEIVFRWEE